MNRVRRTKNSAKNDPESDPREILRRFARKTLSTQKLRDVAAKKIETQPSYLHAMLNQRGIGGFDIWTALMVHCFDTLGVDLCDTLNHALRNPERLKDTSAQSPSETVFKNLDQISIVNEDVKFQLASHLEKMLKGLEKSLESHVKRK